VSEGLGLAVKQCRSALLKLGFRDSYLRKLARCARLLFREARLLHGETGLHRRATLEPNDHGRCGERYEQPPEPPDAPSAPLAIHDERALQPIELIPGDLVLKPREHVTRPQKARRSARIFPLLRRGSQLLALARPQRRPQIRSQLPGATDNPATRSSAARLTSEPLITRLSPIATPPSASTRTFARYSAPVVCRRSARYVQTLPPCGNDWGETDRLALRSEPAIAVSSADRDVPAAVVILPVPLTE